MDKKNQSPGKPCPRMGARVTAINAAKRTALIAMQVDDAALTAAIACSCGWSTAAGAAARRAHLLLHVPQDSAVPLKALHAMRVLVAAPREEVQRLRVVHELEVRLADVRQHPRGLEVLRGQLAKGLDRLAALVLRQQAVAAAEGLQQLHDGRLAAQAVAAGRRRESERRRDENAALWILAPHRRCLHASAAIAKFTTANIPAGEA